VNKEAAAIIKDLINKHGRVIFNGNGYNEDWVKEAKKRGLPNLNNMVDAIATMANDSAVKLFGKYKVLSETELHSRYEVYLEMYVKYINIEAQASIQMVRKQYLPAVMKYTGELASIVRELKAAGGNSAVQKAKLGEVSALLTSASKKLAALEAITAKASAIGEAKHKAEAFRDKVKPAMNALRADIDALEWLLPENEWPVPSYADMLFKSA
jgi:glutamine synthetase